MGSEEGAVFIWKKTWLNPKAMVLPWGRSFLGASVSSSVTCDSNSPGLLGLL